MMLGFDFTEEIKVSCFHEMKELTIPFGSSLLKLQSRNPTRRRILSVLGFIVVRLLTSVADRLVR